MTTERSALFLTGATGLVGGLVLDRILRAHPGREVFVLVRDEAAWVAYATARGFMRPNVRAVRGDLTHPGLGLDREARSAVAGRVGTIVHSAADTVFSRPLDEARRVNTFGTERVVELALRCGRLERLVYLSTAFVAGRRTGRVLERDNGAEHGFVNGYEQSKYEAETLLRASELPWVVVRPSAIVCDGASGHVTQYNAVHRALRLYHAGLASMMPGNADNRIDIVPADYVADCTTQTALTPDIEGSTFHVCTGDRAITIGELLDRAYEIWIGSPEWRKRSVPKPALTDLDTYRLFEQSVEQTGDARLKAITRSLSHFVPQLALPKEFDTSGTEALTRRPPPSAGSFWPEVVHYLLRSNWAAEARRAA